MANRSVQFLGSVSLFLLFLANPLHAADRVGAGEFIYFEGLTIRNTGLAILAGRKDIIGSSGLTVKHSRFENVGRGVLTDWSGSKEFYIAEMSLSAGTIRTFSWVGREGPGKVCRDFRLRSFPNTP